MRPLIQTCSDRKFSYRHSEARGADRGYKRLLDWCNQAPRNTLLMFTMTYLPELQLSPRRSANKWTRFAKMVLRPIKWLDAWARVFETNQAGLHVHVLLRINKPILMIQRRKISPTSEMVLAPRFIAKFVRRVIRYTKRAKIGRTQIKRAAGSKEKLCFYLTHECRERGKRWQPRPAELKGVRLIEFSRAIKNNKLNL